jgi:predicted nucleic acid-binding Zn ribbon protein
MLLGTIQVFSKKKERSKVMEVIYLYSEELDTLQELTEVSNSKLIEIASEVSKELTKRVNEAWDRLPNFKEDSTTKCEEVDELFAQNNSVEPKQPKTTETMMVDGEPTEIDPLSYEVGYSHGQSEPPKGEWERISFPDGEVMECTNCGYRDWVDVWEEESRNFCPNCGADMRGGYRE